MLVQATFERLSLFLLSPSRSDELIWGRQADTTIIIINQECKDRQLPSFCLKVIKTYECLK